MRKTFKFFCAVAIALLTVSSCGKIWDEFDAVHSEIDALKAKIEALEKDLNAKIATINATLGDLEGQVAVVDVKKVYTITVGNWRKGSGKDLTVYVNAPVAELLEVRIDGEILNTNRYTAFGTTGTTIKLKNSYLEACPAGTYSIEVEYEDGDVEETFKIKKEIVNAETGDFFNMYLWIGMLVLSFSAVVVLLAMRRKRKW
jgi:outer membrane murein-binding lipoprotein Lpp